MKHNDPDINRDPMKTQKNKKFKTINFKISQVEKDESHDSISYVMAFSCRNCGSTNIKERSGYKVCFNCGEHH